MGVNESQTIKRERRYWFPPWDVPVCCHCWQDVNPNDQKCKDHGYGDRAPISKGNAIVLDSIALSRRYWPWFYCELSPEQCGVLNRSWLDSGKKVETDLVKRPGQTFKAPSVFEVGLVQFGKGLTSSEVAAITVVHPMVDSSLSPLFPGTHCIPPYDKAVLKSSPYRKAKESLFSCATPEAVESYVVVWECLGWLDCAGRVKRLSDALPPTPDEIPIEWWPEFFAWLGFHHPESLLDKDGRAGLSPMFHIQFPPRSIEEQASYWQVLDVLWRLKRICGLVGPLSPKDIVIKANDWLQEKTASAVSRTVAGGAAIPAAADAADNVRGPLLDGRLAAREQGPKPGQKSTETPRAMVFSARGGNDSPKHITSWDVELLPSQERRNLTRAEGDYFAILALAAERDDQNNEDRKYVSREGFKNPECDTAQAHHMTDPDGSRDRLRESMPELNQFGFVEYSDEGNRIGDDFTVKTTKGSTETGSYVQKVELTVKDGQQ